MENTADKIILDISGDMPELIDLSENKVDKDDALSIADDNENEDIDLIVNETHTQSIDTEQETCQAVPPVGQAEPMLAEPEPPLVDTTPPVEKNNEEQMADHGQVKTIINELTSESESAPNKFAKTRRPRKSRALTMKDGMQEQPRPHKPQVRKTQRPNPNKNLVRKSRYRKRNEDLISF
jgi:hypothetical protein